MANANDIGDVASGVAALSICESLLLAMGDLKIINEEEAVAVIEDAAAAWRLRGVRVRQSCGDRHRSEPAR